MSVCGQTEDASALEEMGAPIREIYEQKDVSKVVRVLTVFAYLLSVSLAAILLSVYYICVWKSPDLPLMNDTEELSARRGELSHYIQKADSASFSGGSNITVSDLITESTSNNISEEFGNTVNSSTSRVEQNESISDQTQTNLSSSPSTAQASYNGSMYDIGILNDTTETDTIT